MARCFHSSLGAQCCGAFVLSVMLTGVVLASSLSPVLAQTTQPPAQGAQATQGTPAQGQPAPAPAPPQGTPPPSATATGPEPPITPGELTRLFDAYAVLQAQGFLKLTDEQYGEFVVALKALQDVRRRHAAERGRLISDLRKLTAPDSTAPDSAVQSTMEQLAREDASADANIAKAYQNVDEVLDLRQRARFRVFEEQIERQKLNLLSRVRRKSGTPPPQSQR